MELVAIHFYNLSSNKFLIPSGRRKDLNTGEREESPVMGSMLGRRKDLNTGKREEFPVPQH